MAASTRDTLLEAWVARLLTLTGWTAVRGEVGEIPRNVAVLAEVSFLSETYQIKVGSPAQYDATLFVRTIVSIRDEEADPDLDGGNAFRYLDRRLTEAQELVHTPDAWGSAGQEVDVSMASVEMLGRDPNGTSTGAFLDLRFTYRMAAESPTLP